MSLKALKPISPESPVSAETESSPITETASAPIQPLSSTDLLTLIASMQQQLLASQQQAAESQKALAAAILETTKPREHVKTVKEVAAEQNEALFKKNEKDLEIRKKSGIKYSQDNCDHIGGCNPLSDERDIRGRTSILWHRTDAGVEVGICLVCQRFFRPSDEPDGQKHDYWYWRKKPSMCRPSASGTRIFMDPARAAEESYLHDS